MKGKLIDNSCLQQIAFYYELECDSIEELLNQFLADCPYYEKYYTIFMDMYNNGEHYRGDVLKDEMNADEWTYYYTFNSVGYDMYLAVVVRTYKIDEYYIDLSTKTQINLFYSKKCCDINQFMYDFERRFPNYTSYTKIIFAMYLRNISAASDKVLGGLRNDEWTYSYTLNYFDKFYEKQFVFTVIERQ